MLSFLMAVTLAAPLIAAPQAELWERWTAHDPNSNLSVDHSRWNSFLEEYVRYSNALDMNVLPYGEVSPEDRRLLESYISELEETAVSELSRPSQKAYWINLYNAKTVQLILEHYPVDSIRDIKLGGLFSRGPWNEEIMEIEGEQLSLNDVEHRILRPIWEDPRIHYAVNCASIGCPDLPPRAYTAAETDRMLDEGARRYINSDRGVAFSDGTLYLSSIYDWFQEDFGGSLEGVFSHLRRYADEETMQELERYSGSVEYRYDWSLNEAP
jgi:hypothetical protein